MHPANSETTSLATAAGTLHFSSLTDISRRAEKLSHPTHLPPFTLSLLIFFTIACHHVFRSLLTELFLHNRSPLLRHDAS